MVAGWINRGALARPAGLTVACEASLVGGLWGFRGLPGPVGAIGLAFELEDDGTVDKPIEEGHGQGDVAEIIAPGLEVDVGDQGSRVLLAAGVDDLVEQTGGLAALRSFNLVEAELIDDQQVEAFVVAQALGQGLVSQASGEVLEQGSTGRVADPVAQGAGSPAE